MPNNTERGLLSRICCTQSWEAEEYALADYMIDRGGPISFVPWTRTGKQNIKGLLDRDDECEFLVRHVLCQFDLIYCVAVDIPEIAKIILREAEIDLRKALNSGVARPNDSIQNMPLMGLAIGWPTGVQILLEFGADASEFGPSRSPYRPLDTMDTDCENYYDSLVPLLQAGCQLENRNILFCTSQKIRVLFIRELLERRKRLQALAQSCLPPQRLAEILGDENDGRILDMQASQICTELLTQGWKVDCSLQVGGLNSQSMYHEWCLNVEAWDELYQIGFRDIDGPDKKGITPLMVHLTYLTHYSVSADYALDRIIWLVKKGASLAKILPCSNGTVAHLATSWAISEILHVISYDIYDKSRRWPGFEARITPYKDTVFLISSARDRCVCACCLGGCTPLSVALRSCIPRVRSAIPPFRGSVKLFRQVFCLLLRWTDTSPETTHAIIRFLTFQALGLRHTCCTEIDKDVPLENSVDLKDQGDIETTREEDPHRYHELEQLVSELESEFHQRSLSIMEFLDNYWHARMIEYLSTPGRYDEEHIQRTRNLGIFLEPHEISIPDEVYYFGNRVEDVTSDNDS